MRSAANIDNGDCGAAGIAPWGVRVTRRMGRKLSEAEEENEAGAKVEAANYGYDHHHHEYVTTTPQTIVHYAGTNIDSVAQQHLNLTAGQQFNLNAGQGVGLFAHHNGISAIAHHGPLMLQAQHDGARIEAATDITWTASGGKLTGMAQEIHLIAADGSFVKIGGGGVTIGTNGPITQQAASFTHSGPATMQTQFPTFGAGQADQRFVLRAAGTGGPALPHAAYEITLSDGSTVSGVSDDQGLTDLLQRDALHIANLRLQKKDA